MSDVGPGVTGLELVKVSLMNLCISVVVSIIGYCWSLKGFLVII